MDLTLVGGSEWKDFVMRKLILCKELVKFCSKKWNAKSSNEYKRKVIILNSFDRAKRITRSEEFIF